MAVKFDYIIGNPPYQESRETTKDMPVYNSFMDEVYSICDKVMLITPGRFLFNAGATPKKWNEKVLQDTHFCVVYYEQNSALVFPNTDIKGGVAVSYHDNKRQYCPIEVFSPYDELNTIRRKVIADKKFVGLNTVMYSPACYRFTDTFLRDEPVAVSLLSKGNERMLATNIFDTLAEKIFFEDCPLENTYIKILGRCDNQRVYRWVRKEYVSGANLNAYKVILPKSTGSGAIGEVLSTPLVGTPMVGYTQSFISIGSFSNEIDADNALKYIKTKFARTCLGILKITQDNPPEKWKYVPLQDFTSNSDIDWAASIPNIDRQLYRKYGLTQEEIDFIETHVKPME